MSSKNDRQRLWAAHCHRMAEATHALADWCEDTEMLGLYLDLAARWIKMSELPPPKRAAER